VAAQHPEAWVIGSDQVAVSMDGQGEIILGKPGTRTRCIEQLRSCSGQHRGLSHGRRRAAPPRWRAREFVDTTRVTFRALDEATIERYVARNRRSTAPAGSRARGSESALCESIDSAIPPRSSGCRLIRLSAALRAVGFPIPCGSTLFGAACAACARAPFPSRRFMGVMASSTAASSAAAAR
jgi:septum formation protein